MTGISEQLGLGAENGDGVVADIEIFMLDLMRVLGILVFLFAITGGKFFSKELSVQDQGSRVTCG